ncbi:bifunctional phosphopantothenoylcysteine decarboxylase/phosphopantothenate--cysteine ligase CoaBC [Spiroplasma taiwanense]|uniref:Coenzyme A biosynthesis bifunctional protein CoaBC n=1 Tax=Spiroplasma taiwanense CT-1 TaxID=1276220 RepID=S5MBI4_9MOLU|nr:bifunctional phosphopantothenoylcysteine decarboxylase/phosphopantothenate--cysteine ligase CoaBC [Spiroplasma taiwanense]AGR41133.1 pantothenate metabolism flavoprotein [Spiroplasma taiwanense CT-1]
MKKTINLIITGGIAASKAKELYQLLITNYNINIILSENAKRFVNFSDFNYIDNIFEKEYYFDNHHYAEHVKIAFNSDLNVVYPATYNYIGKITNGIADDICSLIFAITNIKTILFPSMNSNMYLNPILEKNKKILLNTSNVDWIEPAIGRLASGHNGIGRAIEPVDVCKIINDYFNEETQFENLKDKKVLLNFGKTRSYIDKVRYITNSSSGKMGLELKKILSSNSKELITVFGDTQIPIESDDKNFYVQTNNQMLEKMKENYYNSDVVICSAALYDFKIKNYINKKIEKREQNELNSIDLVEAIDVLKELGKIKKNQFLVGFSLSNEFDLNKAWVKINEKNLDMLIINLVNALESDYNELKIIITKTKEVINITKMHKSNIAKEIIKIINQNI